MKEIVYHECNGLQTVCPYDMKEPLYNSFTSKTPSGYGDIYVGSLSCKKCKHFIEDGKYSKKSVTSWYHSIYCNYQ